MSKHKRIDANTISIKFAVGGDFYSIERDGADIEIEQNGQSHVRIHYHGWVALTDAIQKIGIEIARDNIK